MLGSKIENLFENKEFERESGGLFVGEDAGCLLARRRQGQTKQEIWLAKVSGRLGCRSSVRAARMED